MTISGPKLQAVREDHMLHMTKKEKGIRSLRKKHNFVSNDRMANTPEATRDR